MFYGQTNLQCINNVSSVYKGIYCIVTWQLLSVHHHGKCFIGDTVNQLAHLPAISDRFILEIQQNSASKSSFLGG